MLEQLTAEQLQELLSRFVNMLMEIPQLKIREIILFGSYARGDADEESDVDLMILTDIPKDEIPSFRHYVSHVAASVVWRCEGSGTAKCRPFFVGKKGGQLKVNRGQLKKYML